MDSVIENFKAKNFDLEVEGNLYAVNRGLDFSGFLDADQALGAVILMDILKDLDEKDCKGWTVYGWYPRESFGDDHDGVMDDVPFFNEAYFTNEGLMDLLWYEMPCLCITKHDHSSIAFIGVDDAPYIRYTIMGHVPMRNVIIRNDNSFPFPGEDAVIAVSDDRLQTKDGFPSWVRFRMPEAYCVIYYEGDERRQIWKFITPEDRERMRAKLHEMEREYWEERE